jgi:hypothetical protein
MYCCRSTRCPHLSLGRMVVVCQPPIVCSDIQLYLHGYRGTHSATGPGLMTTNNAGRTWKVPPNGDMCTLGYCMYQPGKGMHDLGESRTFASPDTNYTSFVANTSRGVTYFYVNETTRTLNTRIVPPTTNNLLNFQLPWNVSCTCCSDVCRHSFVGRSYACLLV